MSAAKVLKVVLGLLLVALGAWLVIYELAMAASESHLLHGTNILYVVGFIVAGVAIALAGCLLLRRSLDASRSGAGSP